MMGGVLKGKIKKETRVQINGGLAPYTILRRHATLFQLGTSLVVAILPFHIAMRKPLLVALLLSVAQLATSCQTDSDLRPASYDELAMATGHWEWERSTQGFSYDKTPASVGYSRQLTFGPDRRLLLRRSGRPDVATTYQFTIYQVTSPTGAVISHPAVSFDTGEADLLTNTLKYYDIRQQNGQQQLTLTGEKAYIDGGAIETYHWVAD